MRVEYHEKDRCGCGEAAVRLWGTWRTCPGLCDTISRLVLRATVREIVDKLMENCLKYTTTPTRRGFNSHEADFRGHLSVLPVLKDERCSCSR